MTKIQTAAVVIIVLALAVVASAAIGAVRSNRTAAITEAQYLAAAAQYRAQAVRETFAGLADLVQVSALALPTIAVTLIATITSLGSFLGLIFILAQRPRRDPTVVTEEVEL